jgi:hypothetical protein
MDYNNMTDFFSRSLPFAIGSWCVCVCALEWAEQINSIDAHWDSFSIPCHESNYIHMLVRTFANLSLSSSLVLQQIKWAFKIERRLKMNFFPFLRLSFILPSWGEFSNGIPGVIEFAPFYPLGLLASISRSLNCHFHQIIGIAIFLVSTLLHSRSPFISPNKQRQTHMNAHTLQKATAR